jgi:uncharacterized protein YaaR (DUF327 family)
MPLPQFIQEALDKIVPDLEKKFEDKHKVMCANDAEILRAIKELDKKIDELTRIVRKNG